MAFGHVLANRGVLVGSKTPLMGGHTFPTLKDFHRRGGVMGFELLARQLVRNAVIMTIDVHVVIDVGANGLPVGQRVTLGRKGCSAGRSSSANREAREPSRFR